MSIYATIIDHIDSISQLYNKPIRVSYYDTYCTVYVFTKNSMRVRRIEYKVIKRIVLRESDSPCSLCYSEFDNDISCFICGNTCCTLCCCNIICVNYTRGIYMCPYCKYERKFANGPNEAKTHILKTLQYLKTNDDHIKIIMHELKKKYPMLFTN